MGLKVVNGREQDLDVEYELFGHADRLEVLPVAYVPEHVRDAGRTGLFEGRQHAEQGIVSRLTVAMRLSTHVQIR
jgi:hypothetical protein